jgi:formate dehydrogenase major subunit
MARRLGLDWSYTHPRDVFAEMRKAMPSIAGITWERLEQESAVTYPCENEGDPGTRVVFTEDFPTANGKARFVPAALVPAAERPDDTYPFVLITGRQLEHWHTGSMTRRATVLDAIEPYPVASLNSADLAQLGVAPGGTITVASRRGEISLSARADDGRRAARCSSCSAITRPPRTCSPIRRSIHSARFLSSGIAPCE